MKWEITYSLKSLPPKRLQISEDPNLGGQNYEVTADSEEKAIQNVKDYIIELFQCNCLAVKSTVSGFIVYDSSDGEQIDEYSNFSGKRVYSLIGKDGKPYESYEPGTLGGHRRLKIYGRLDCPSAARYIAKGQYVQHRVFFPNEETAIAAGYRPCAVCMPEKI